MSRDPAPTLAAPAPLPRLIEPVLGGLAYLGALGILATSAAQALVRPRGAAPGLWPALSRQFEGLIGIGLPLVLLVHVPLGSFLAMQAFFGATFNEGAGAIVGLGLVRNLAPLATGLVLAGVQAGRIIPDLRLRPHADLDGDPSWVPDRDITRGDRPDPRPAPGPGRLTAVRVLAALCAGPVLAVWGAAVGLVIGLLVSRSMLAIPPSLFVAKLMDMIQPLDAVGLVAKSAVYAGIVALFCCHEGLRPGGRDADSLRSAAYRALCFAGMLILVVNASWFSLAYLSGSPFGPDLAA